MEGGQIGKTVQLICGSHEDVLHRIWEMEEFHYLIDYLHGLAAPNNLLDVWSWGESGDGLFTLSFYYKRLLVSRKFPPMTLFGSLDLRGRCVSLYGWRQGV